MFTVPCECGGVVLVGESRLNQIVTCQICDHRSVCVTAEPISDEDAAHHFDAALLVVDGPERAGQLLRLGGHVPIILGSAPGSTLLLPGASVAPEQCELVRINEMPSRWELRDGQGRTLVNGNAVHARELEDGDIITIGEYELAYRAAVPSAAPALTPVATSGQVENPMNQLRAQPDKPKAVAARPSHAHEEFPICPSCGRDLDPGATICVQCGIHTDTGRPLLTSIGLDEDEVQVKGEAAVKIVSWFLWVTPLPIPLISSAYGRFKPVVTWVLSALVVALSLWYFVGVWGHGAAWNKNIRLWASKTAVPTRLSVPKSFPNFRTQSDGTPYYYSGDELIDAYRKAVAERSGEFHLWQLLTYAWIHDPDSLLCFVLCLGGNLLWVYVFGSRVNATVGNRTMLAVHPIAAIVGGIAFVAAAEAGELRSMTGAAGVAAGLAGMYLVLLPAHYVYCAMWMRMPLSFLFAASGGDALQLSMKIFRLRGFWLTFIFLAYDAFVVWVADQGLAAYLSHLAAFSAGIVGGLALLMARKYNVSNGDLLSLTLGKYAWPLIGKPSQWEKTEAVEPQN